MKRAPGLKCETLQSWQAGMVTVLLSLLFNVLVLSCFLQFRSVCTEILLS